MLIAAAVGAAVAGAVVVVPSLIRGTEAFASWSATPVALHGAARTTALQACLVLQGNQDGELALVPGASASALVAEARGGWSYVLFEAEGPSGRALQGSCLVPATTLSLRRVPGTAASSEPSEVPRRSRVPSRRPTSCVRTPR